MDTISTRRMIKEVRDLLDKIEFQVAYEEEEIRKKAPASKIRICNICGEDYMYEHGKNTKELCGKHKQEKRRWDSQYYIWKKLGMECCICGKHTKTIWDKEGKKVAISKLWDMGKERINKS